MWDGHIGSVGVGQDEVEEANNLVSAFRQLLVGVISFFCSGRVHWELVEGLVGAVSILKVTGNLE